MKLGLLLIEISFLVNFSAFGVGPAIGVSLWPVYERHAEFPGSRDLNFSTVTSTIVTGKKIRSESQSGFHYVSEGEYLNSLVHDDGSFLTAVQLHQKSPYEKKRYRVVRTTGAGKLDLSFGTNGFVDLDFRPLGWAFTGITTIVVGSQDNDYFLKSLGSNGVFDKNFGKQGRFVWMTSNTSNPELYIRYFANDNRVLIFNPTCDLDSYTHYNLGLSGFSVTPGSACKDHGMTASHVFDAEISGNGESLALVGNHLWFEHPKAALFVKKWDTKGQSIAPSNDNSPVKVNIDLLNRTLLYPLTPSGSQEAMSVRITGSRSGGYYLGWTHLSVFNGAQGFYLTRLNVDGKPDPAFGEKGSKKIFDDKESYATDCFYSKEYHLGRPLEISTNELLVPLGLNLDRDYKQSAIARFDDKGRKLQFGRSISPTCGNYAEALVPHSGAGYWSALEHTSLGRIDMQLNKRGDVFLMQSTLESIPDYLFSFASKFNL